MRIQLNRIFEFTEAKSLAIDKASTLAIMHIEDVAQLGLDGVGWMQLHEKRFFYDDLENIYQEFNSLYPKQNRLSNEEMKVEYPHLLR